MSTPTDPLYNDQWHFALLGNIEAIWDEYTGNGVTVAVYDDGVEYTHEDLDGNYDASMHFQYDIDGDGTDEVFDPTPISNYDGHGTACAGIIGAEANNGAGGTGVAYGVTLTGVNLLSDIQNGDGIGGFDQNDIDFITAALEHAQNFDIMSNSWGRSPIFADYQNYDTLLEVGAFETVSVSGRGGLGTIVVQAAGNDTMNVNGDGVNASRHTITVAATDANGDVTDYSNWGVGLLISAPASAVTTDLSGEAGYNWDDVLDEPFGAQVEDTLTDTDYTEIFGGTSAATPTVAGVIALMLEANENLGWRDVQNILAVTAAQTGSTMGSLATGYEVSEWVTSDSDGGSSWNGGGLSYNGSYGFGMVDAFAAVRMAEVWLEMFGTAQTSANEQLVTFDYSGAAITITDATVDPISGAIVPSVTTVDFTVSQNIQIETVMVTVDITHTWGTDLSFGLIAPDGTIIPLFFNEGTSSTMDFGWEWTFEISALLGYDSAGTWTLAFEDNFDADEGTLNDFQIEFYGSTATNDDVHIVSRDFLEMIAYDSARSALIDTNGGTDWLNFVGVNSDGIGNGDLIVTMGSGGAFSVDGVAWGTIDGAYDMFENLAAGDGDDHITGNTLDNRILGLRGDDTIFGAVGDDTLEGGAGSDTLNGGDDDDVLVGGNGNDTLDGGADNDDISGGSGNDVLIGGDGDDVMDGGAARDTINGDNGNDIIDGGDRNDRIFGGSNNDTLSGGEGNDRIRGNSGSDEIDGGSGNDRIYGDGGRDLVDGGNGDDRITGGSQDDDLFGGDGDDDVFGGDAHDYVDGGIGDDNLRGNDGDDFLDGGDGDDRLRGDAGADLLYGGEGDDTLSGGSGRDIFIFFEDDENDVITDFSMSLDELFIEYGSVSDGQTLVDTYAAIVGSDVVFNFSATDILTIEGIATGGFVLDDLVANFGSLDDYL